MAVKIYKVTSQLIYSQGKLAMVMRKKNNTHLSGIEYGRTEKAKEYEARDNPSFHEPLLGPPEVKFVKRKIQGYFCTCSVRPSEDKHRCSAMCGDKPHLT